MDYEIGSMDGAYKGRLHVAWPFIGRKTLTERQKEYNDVHGFYRARIEHLFARMWHWGIVRNIWRGSDALFMAFPVVHHVCYVKGR